MNIFGKIRAQYLFECTLIILAVSIGVVLLLMFVKNNDSLQKAPPVVFSQAAQSTLRPDAIRVDIEGAVKKPGSYQLRSGSRVEELISEAGGFAMGADISYVSKEINKAKVLEDQEKIYIPTATEVKNGFTPSVGTQETGTPEDSADTSLVSINTGLYAELDAIPGVGAATVQKIIGARPYHSLDDLITKKVLSQSLFVKIKPFIRL